MCWLKKKLVSTIYFCYFLPRGRLEEGVGGAEGPLPLPGQVAEHRSSSIPERSCGSSLYAHLGAVGSLQSHA